MKTTITYSGFNSYEVRLKVFYRTYLRFGVRCFNSYEVRLKGDQLHHRAIL